jgi:hypothetical protein
MTHLPFIRSALWNEKPVELEAIVHEDDHHCQTNVEKFSGSKAAASFAVSNRMRKKDKPFFLLRHKDDVT